jgi:hypothetical protein
MATFDFKTNLTNDQITKCSKVRIAFKELAQIILDNAPEGRERALAITKLEESSFWIIKSITHQESK